MGYLFFLLCLFAFIFALLGMEIFGGTFYFCDDVCGVPEGAEHATAANSPGCMCDFDEDSPPRVNFDTFRDAMLASSVTRAGLAVHPLLGLRATKTSWAALFFVVLSGGQLDPNPSPHPTPTPPPPPPHPHPTPPPPPPPHRWATDPAQPLRRHPDLPDTAYTADKSGLGRDARPAQVITTVTPLKRQISHAMQETPTARTSSSRMCEACRDLARRPRRACAHAELVGERLPSPPPAPPPPPPLHLPEGRARAGVGVGGAGSLRVRGAAAATRLRAARLRATRRGRRRAGGGRQGQRGRRGRGGV